MGDKIIFRTVILITSIVLLCLGSSSLASSIGGMPGGGGMGSTTFISDNANIPIEARIGEDIDVGVQHDDTTIFILFPLSLRYDNKIRDIKLEKYFKKVRLSDTRMRIGLDESLLDDKEIKQLVNNSQLLTIDFEKNSGSTSEADIYSIKLRTQNGFQSYVKSDFNRSGFTAALLSIVPGLGYSYADESTSAQCFFFSRVIILGIGLSPGTQLSSIGIALSGILFFAEAKNSVSLVQKKNKVAEDLRGEGFADEGQLLLRDMTSIQKNPKKYVKYPSAMFDLSLVAGARLFPFKSADRTGSTMYSGFSIGFRDYFIDSFDQKNEQKIYRRSSYYDDFYAFGWKNVYSVGYDEYGGQFAWSLGLGRAYHTEWVDLMGGINIGKYDNPASICFESKLNLAPLTCFNGTYVEVHSPYY